MSILAHVATYNYTDHGLHQPVTVTSNYSFPCYETVIQGIDNNNNAEPIVVTFHTMNRNNDFCNSLVFLPV